VNSGFRPQHSLELIADDHDRLYLNEEIGIGEVIGCDRHARWKLALEKLATSLDESLPSDWLRIITVMDTQIGKYLQKST
jgi:hypothetical protein